MHIHCVAMCIHLLASSTLVIPAVCANSGLENCPDRLQNFRFHFSIASGCCCGASNGYKKTEGQALGIAGCSLRPMQPARLSDHCSPPLTPFSVVFSCLQLVMRSLLLLALFALASGLATASLVAPDAAVMEAPQFDTALIQSGEQSQRQHNSSSTPMQRGCTIERRGLISVLCVACRAQSIRHP